MLETLKIFDLQQSFNYSDPLISNGTLFDLIAHILANEEADSSNFLY